MYWTHIFDFIFKVVSMLLSILLLLQFPILEEHPYVLILSGVILFFILFNFVFRTLSSYLYCKAKLKMPLSLREAVQLNEVLSPFNPFGQRWLPLLEVKSVEPIHRFEKALQLKAIWQEQNNLKKEDKPENSKAVTIGSVVLVILLAIISLLNVPPASYIADAVSVVMGEDKYYPMLNMAILILIAVLIYVLILKIFKRK